MSGIKSNDDVQWDKFSSSPNIESIAVALSIDSSGDLFWKMISTIIPTVAMFDMMKLRHMMK